MPYSARAWLNNLTETQAPPNQAKSSATKYHSYWNRDWKNCSSPSVISKDEHSLCDSVYTLSAGTCWLQPCTRFYDIWKNANESTNTTTTAPRYDLHYHPVPFSDDTNYQRLSEYYYRARHSTGNPPRTWL